MIRVTAAAALALCILSSASAQTSGWTFCVASALDSKDAWLTEVFSTSRGRDQLEEELRAFVAAQHGPRIVAQCPAPTDDKIAAVNSQTGAEAFNHKLGVALHPVSEHDFPRR
jgi:hypothetical protein